MAWLPLAAAACADLSLPLPRPLQFTSAFESAFAGVGNVVSTGNDTEELRQVGRRKRAAGKRWDWLEQQRARGGWMVPPERALVPISVYAESLRN